MMALQRIPRIPHWRARPQSVSWNVTPRRKEHFSFAVSVLTLAGAAIGSALLALHQGGEPDPAVIATIAAASLISSIAGFAFSAICGGILFHLWYDHVQVVQMMIACSIANQAAMVWALRRDIDQHSLLTMSVGGVAGLPLGVFMLLHVNQTVYTHALGYLLLAYGAYTLVSKPRVFGRQHPSFDVIAGFLGGITGGAAGFPGAPVTIWCGLKGWDKQRQRAVYQPFILLMQIAALDAISTFRSRNGSEVGFEPRILLCIPAGLLGTWLGLACFRRLSNRQFALIVNVLPIISGLSYLR